MEGKRESVKLIRSVPETELVGERAREVDRLQRAAQSDVAFSENDMRCPSLFHSGHSWITMKKGWSSFRRSLPYHLVESY